jgi:hypothetical protein
MDPRSSPIADALNTRPKYVASNMLTDPRWADTTVLSGDVSAAIGDFPCRCPPAVRTDLGVGCARTGSGRAGEASHPRVDLWVGFASGPAGSLRSGCADVAPGHRGDANQARHDRDGQQYAESAELGTRRADIWHVREDTQIPRLLWYLE